MRGITPARSKVLSSSYTYAKMTQQEIDNLFGGSWLARAIVEIPAKDMFRNWRDWQAEPEQITKIEDVEARLNLRNVYTDAMEYARKDGLAYVYFDTGRDPSKPLSDADRDIRFVNVLRKSEVAEGDADDDAMSPNYGFPAWYEVTGSRSMVRIHPSRMVIFHGVKSARNHGWVREYDSVLAPCQDAIKAHDMTHINIADLTGEAKIDVIKTPDLMEQVKSPEGERNITARGSLISEGKSNNNTILMDALEEWSQKSVSFATLPEVLNSMQAEVSGAAKIPRALLFGVSEGGLGSTGNLELSSYYDRIGAEQETHVRPATNNLDRLIVKSALGRDIPEVHYTWATLWQMSAKDKSEIGDKIAAKWQKLVQSGILPADVASESAVNDLVEAGVAPGLEQVWADWTASEPDLPEDDEPDMLSTNNEDE